MPVTPTHSIAVVVGSLRRDSFNRRLANALKTLVPPEFELKLIELGDLPLYNQDDDAHPAESVQRFKAAIAVAHAVLVVTPEYNRSIPGVLKNALDHGSRPQGQSVWKGKPAGILGVSPGTLGTALAQQHLRHVLAALDMPTLSQPEVYVQVKEGVFAEDGSLSEASRKPVQAWLDRYVAWVKRLHQSA